MDCAVAGRGFYTLPDEYAGCRNPSLHPPKGGNRTIPPAFLFLPNTYSVVTNISVPCIIAIVPHKKNEDPNVVGDNTNIGAEFLPALLYYQFV
ncbi:hypothetical protein HYN43_020095 [Mucilaginibacter celer]|uniref:Uncharacterized protein n=1 Tax=Mucilaginibacter celer TaxID=2305508 RepID=A0A494W1P1_9SPHI|nr:hypothetical protein HYN43_020095 [Mucilaginibacter celer]